MGLLEFLKWTKIHYFFFGIIFLTSGLLINVVQLFLFIFLRPVSRNFFRRINYYVSYSLSSQIVFLLQYWANVQVTLHVNKNEYFKYFGKEHALLIMNHTYEIDWMIGWVLCENCKVLGNCKAFVKKALQYVPTFGFSWKLSESIFLERDWNKDQSIVKNCLQELIAYKEPFWLLLTAEGTRFTKEKHEASKAFAKQHGLPILRHHLTPRTRGFTISVPHLRKNVPAIYNINVGVKPNEISPTLSNILLGKSISADLYVERIPMEELPESEDGLAAWLHSFYKRKDDLLSSYLETGSWFETSTIKKCDSFLLPRRIFPALNLAVWSVTILVPLGYLILKLLISGHILYFGILILCICSFAFFLNKLVEETKISKSSSYGVSKSKTVIENSKTD